MTRTGLSLSSAQLQIAREAAEHLPTRIQGGSVLTGGRINDTWRLETDQGPLVLRLYPLGRRRRQVEFEVAVMQHARSENCAVPDIIAAADGQTVRQVRGQLAVWFSYIDGSSAEDARPVELRRLLQPLFSALNGFDPPFGAVAETHVAASLIEPFVATLPPPHSTRIRKCFDELRTWEKQHLLPTSVIHADIHPDNVLCDEEGRLWIIDFDDAHVGTRALDWVLAALEFSFEGERLNEDKYRQLLQQLRPSSTHPLAAQPEEIAAEPRLRELLVLKHAAIEHDLDTPTEHNRYLRLLTAPPLP